MVVSESSIALITFSEKLDVLSIVWKAKPNMEQFKLLYWETLQFVKSHHKVCYYSTDISQIGPLDPEQENWLNREYYPQVAKIIGEDIYAAVIFSDGHFKALISNYIATHMSPLNDFIHFNYFTVSEEALDWLMLMQKGQDPAYAANS